MGVAHILQPHPQQQMPQHTAMQQAPINYHPGHPMNVGLPPSGGMPPHAGAAMYGPPHGGMDTPSTQITELQSTPVSQFTGMVSPQGANHFAHFEGMRPKDLPIDPPHSGGGEYHQGNPGERSNMYYNDDAPAGEQVDFRGEGAQPPFNNTCDDNFMCGQGKIDVMS